MRNLIVDNAVNYTVVSPAFTLTRRTTGVLLLSIAVRRHFTVMPTILDTGK